MAPRLAGPPPPDVEVPGAVRRIAAGRAIEPIWENQLGGLTFRIAARTDVDARYVKWQPHGVAIDLDAEAARLEWLAPYAAVPRLLDRGSDDEGRWIVTAALRGRSAVDERWKSDPGPAVDALGSGLRAFHDSVPVDGCPFDWSVEERLARGGCPDVGPSPEIDVVVVCHGDACAPNTLIADDGTFVGHTDVGSCGVADRWADLAVGSMSLEWNFGAGWDDRYFDAYGIDPDPERIDFYRRLWNAT